MKLITVYFLNRIYDNILVLNTLQDENQPIKISVDGFETISNFNFAYETEVLHSCSVLFEGQMLVLGGMAQPRQISLVQDCTLRRISTLVWGL